MFFAHESAVGLVALNARVARHSAVQLGLQPILTVVLIVLNQRRGIIAASAALTGIKAPIHRYWLCLSSGVLDRVRKDLAAPRIAATH
jgi:hypothetical protein